MKNKVSKFIVGFISTLLLIVVLLVSSGIIWAKVTAPKSFPQVDGTINLKGLTAQVVIYRDKMGIPNIYASNLHDIFMAQGYIHAQERFWQMDFWRHIGSATLAEMFPSEVKTDIFLRTLGWGKLAEQEYTDLDPATKEILTSYAEGVNAYLEDHSGTTISLEYGILKLLNPGYKPSPWTPENSLTWAKSMAWDLGGNMSEEINRAILLKTMPLNYVNELYPPYPSDHPIIVPTIGDNASAPIQSNATVQVPTSLLNTVQQKVTLVNNFLGPGGNDIGSNSWVVSGSLTTTGKPLLANDPHLGIQMPSIWFQVGLHCQPKSADCPYNVTGFSFAGVPGIVIGHNDRIAWGFTNVGPDVMDLFIEKINPDNPNQYEYLGKWVDMDVRKETIQVAGGQPVEISVRSTIHGPIISDSYGPLKQQVETPSDSFTQRSGIALPDQYAIALRWTALEPNRLFSAIWGFDKAMNWTDFRTAARDFAVPAQNLVYADVEGNIGYQMPGNIPIRKKGDGRLPVTGWTGEYDWQGYIPFDELPYVFNPQVGSIIAANNQVNPLQYPYLITTDWDYGFRAERIKQMTCRCSGNQKMDIARFKAIQSDNYDASAALLVPFLEKLDLHDAKLTQYKALFNDWDFQDSAGSAPAALYNAFWSRFLKNTFGDDLPKDMQPVGSSRWFQVVKNILGDEKSHWWDDSITPDKVETREDIFRTSFSQAVSDVQSLLGNDPTKWSWGKLHTATFENQTLGQSGIPPIEMLFNRGPFETSGGASIVNATGWKANLGFAVTSLPSMRMIVDLSDLGNSITVHPTGQSGHAYDPHYIDMADLWRNFEYYPMLWGDQAITDSAVSHLVLKP